MNTIIATGNNFGAGQIQFTAFQDTNLLILNKEITFDPTNASYQAADELEIYVPDLNLEKSAISGMLMFGAKNGEKNGTAIKSYIRDKNTIVVEKVTAFDDNDTVTLVFSNSYVPRNIKAPVVRMPRNYLSLSEKVGSISTAQSYWTANDEWVFLGVTFSRFEQTDGDTQVSFKIKDLPEIEDFDIIMMDNQAISPSVGTEMFRIEVRDNVFTCEPIHPETRWHELQYCGFIVYIPRKATE